MWWSLRDGWEVRYVVRVTVLHERVQRCRKCMTGRAENGIVQYNAIKVVDLEFGHVDEREKTHLHVLLEWRRYVVTRDVRAPSQN